VVSILGKITICAFSSLSVDFPHSLWSQFSVNYNLNFPSVLSLHLPKSFVFAAK
jgi:hypothetical protein